MLTEDNRMGGVRRFVLHPIGQPLMQIPQDILKCVAFLYSMDRHGVYSPIGTCFFLSYDLGDDLGWVSYAVTARHVIKNADVDGNDGHSHCRLNMRGGGVDWIQLPFSS